MPDLWPPTDPLRFFACTTHASFAHSAINRGFWLRFLPVIRQLFLPLLLGWGSGSDQWGFCKAPRDNLDCKNKGKLSGILSASWLALPAHTAVRKDNICPFKHSKDTNILKFVRRQQSGASERVNARKHDCINFSPICWNNFGKYSPEDIVTVQSALICCAPLTRNPACLDLLLISCRRLEGNGKYHSADVYFWRFGFQVKSGCSSKRFLFHYKYSSFSSFLFLEYEHKKNEKEEL